MSTAALYSSFITSIGDGTGYTDAILHVHGGMVVLFATRVLTGRSLATPWPLVAVFVAALGKEFADFLAYGHIKPDTWSDIAHTVFWPMVLFVGLRMRRTRSEPPVSE